jgi:hypothetical protein
MSITMILLTGGILLWPSLASAALIPTTVEQWGVDDYNTSTLNPSPAIAVSSIASVPPGQCVWINTGMDTFVASHAGWSYSWAGATEEAKVEAGITIQDYYAWVVKIPAVTDGGGNNYPGNNTLQDVGGAVLKLQYTPPDGAHDFTAAGHELHWVQGLRAHYDTYAAGEYQVRLDGVGATPFYDTLGAAGTLPGGGGYFLDRPFNTESEPLEKNPVADVQFQVVLADYNTATKAVTLYGGEWWGYTYNAVDALVPEPATLMMLAFGGIGLLMFRRVSRKQSVN